MIDGYSLTCPYCDFRGGKKTDFSISLCDECFCPKCGGMFLFEFDDFELDDEDDEELVP